MRNIHWNITTLFLVHRYNQKNEAILGQYPSAVNDVAQNDNALALIVGIADYERTDAPAIYADKDAQFFHDYASLKLGIPDSNINTMVNDKAELLSRQ